MKYSIGIKGFPNCGLSNGMIIRDPQNLDLFNSLQEVLLYMDEYNSSLDADLKDLGLENEDLNILKVDDTPYKSPPLMKYPEQ